MSNKENNFIDHKKKDVYEHHKKIYDIIDQTFQLQKEMKRLSILIDENQTLPNSLQAILGMIYRYEGTTQTHLADLYEMDRKNTIKYVTQLEKRGYIKKVEQGNKKLLYLTDQGRMVNDHFMRARGALIDYLLDAVPESDREITRNTLVKISHLIKKYNQQLDEQ